MATTRDLKKAASELIQDWTKSKTGNAARERLAELSRRIESLSEAERTASRDRSIRVSADGMYVRQNTGSYISKTEAERAVSTIERLAGKKK
jgi:hypothetical protein